MKTSATSQVREIVLSKPLGEPFPLAELTACGSRAAVDQAVKRLVASGAIERVAYGIYVRPEVNPLIGKIRTSPARIAAAIAKREGATLQVSGARAVNELGLSTQVPLKQTLLSSGRSRTIVVGKSVVVVRHVSLKKLALAGKPAGLALTALWYLGKKGASVETLRKIQAKLPHEEFADLLAARNIMPGWMASLVHQFERERA